jgi:hypothetical protein
MTTNLGKMERQRAEFDAANNFAKALKRHNQTPVVDDDYPEARHRYESALSNLIDAMKNNGRFSVGNRFGLTEK